MTRVKIVQFCGALSSYTVGQCQCYTVVLELCALLVTQPTDDQTERNHRRAVTNEAAIPTQRRKTHELQSTVVIT